jgi:hypothetical protein
LILNKYPYRVLGELGRFEFYYYRTTGGKSYFEKQSGKEYYKTLGYKELVLYNGASIDSYRTTAQGYDYITKQNDFHLSPKSIENQIISESKRIKTSIRRKVQSQNSNDEQPIEQASSFAYLLDRDYKKEFKEMLEQAPEELQKHLVEKAVRVEDPRQTIYIEIDEICCKEQKSSRKQIDKEEEKRKEEKRKEARTKGKKPYRESKYLFQTVCHISKLEQRFSLVSNKKDSILPQYTELINTFVKSVNCQKDNKVFFTDGARDLQAQIQKEYGDTHSKMILDWYHLAKKVSSQLMMGMKRSSKREDKESEIKKYLWYGLCDQANNTINDIQAEDIKNQKALEILKGYIDRQNSMIPNYDLRKRLGLKNSSSRVEKENDLLIAQRQKRKGMSWSKKGSNALATIQMLKQLNQVESFHRSGEFIFDWAA